MAPTRAQKVSTLAGHLYLNVICPEFERIKTTGMLLPSYSCRHRRTRELLAWASELEGRWFTMNMVREAVASLMKEGKIEVPEVPGFNQNHWITDQSSVLQKLLMRAKKSTSKADMSNPDECDTVPWQLEAELDPNEDTRV